MQEIPPQAEKAIVGHLYGLQAVIEMSLLQHDDKSSPK